MDIIIFIYMLWASGLIDGSDVTQTDILWKDKGDHATMNCSHTKGSSYYEMYWYRQLSGKTIKLLVLTRFGNEEHDFGGLSKEKFGASRSGTESGTFTVKNLEPEDKGLIDGSDVTQTDILWEKQGDNGTMQCSHTKGVQHYQMCWYRQLPGETMKLIVYTQLLIDHDFGDSSKDKFAATKPDVETGTFTVKNLKPEDKALYFCAGDLKYHKFSQLHFDQTPHDIKTLPPATPYISVSTLTVMCLTLNEHEHHHTRSHQLVIVSVLDKSDTLSSTSTELTALERKANTVSDLNFFNMIFGVFIFCFLQLPGNNGASHSKSVFQTPPFIMKKTGQSVAREINCSHSITNYDVILWYKQDQHKALKLLGYLNINIQNVEKDVEGKISFDGNGQTHSRLSISDLALDDSGVYFCAASQHSAADFPHVNTKTLLYLSAERQHVESLQHLQEASI
ncbi:hypothetical protein ABVT39_012075 [Epinephelus coioides]